MFRRSARRFSTAILVVLSLLFSQLALANYACPSEPAQAVAAMNAMEKAPGEPCDGMAMVEQDKAQPVLCHQHCADAPQAAEPGKVPTVTLPAVLHVFMVQLLLAPSRDEPSAHADAGALRPPPDPLFLSTLRLRV